MFASVRRITRLSVVISCAALFLAGVVRRSGPGRGEAIDRVETVRRALRVPPGPLNAVFRWSVRAEAPLRRFSWLRGGSLVAVAQAPRDRP